MMLEEKFLPKDYLQKILHSHTEEECYAVVARACEDLRFICFPNQTVRLVLKNLEEHLNCTTHEQRNALLLLMILYYDMYEDAMREVWIDECHSQLSDMVLNRKSGYSWTETIFDFMRDYFRGKDIPFLNTDFTLDEEKGKRDGTLNEYEAFVGLHNFLYEINPLRKMVCYKNATGCLVLAILIDIDEEILIDEEMNCSTLDEPDLYFTKNSHFVSPTYLLGQAAYTIEKILKRTGYPNVAFKKYVIYTSKKAVFTNEEEYRDYFRENRITNIFMGRDSHLLPLPDSYVEETTLLKVLRKAMLVTTSIFRQIQDEGIWSESGQYRAIDDGITVSMRGKD